MSTEEIEIKLKQEEYFKIKYEKLIWNEAIEAAAKSIGKGMTEVDLGELAYVIRKLRK